MKQQYENRHKLLLLPFMQMPSGHHHVADVIIDEIKQYHDAFICEKMDILTYSFGRMEKLVSSIYLSWIKYFPDSYNRLYAFLAYGKKRQHNWNSLYETLFLPSFKRLIEETDPRVIFCTHALPSYLAAILKQRESPDYIVINVYTDFFINRLWGLTGIDYHFVPTNDVKKELIEMGVAKRKIFVTGIPVHTAFQETKVQKRQQDRITILAAGGNLGMGDMERLCSKTSGEIIYYVLCGKNRRLYNRLIRKKKENIIPLPYISRKEEMNALYDHVDGVLTKPGGVTISECLHKQKPIFLYHPLPGQETINMERLKRLGVAIPLLLNGETIDQEIIHFFRDGARKKELGERLQAYHESMESSPAPLKKVVQQLLKRHCRL